MKKQQPQIETFLTPVGRMVMGSLYDPQTKNQDGSPMVFKSGKNVGKPRVNYFFMLAIKKNGEMHWNQTEWGMKICNAAKMLYPLGESNRPIFSWKIQDGDSTIPNGNSVRPCDCIGFAGHWVLKFGGAFAPALIDRNREYLTQPDAIKCGDYIQVNVAVNPNYSNTPQNIGIVLNCTHVALIGYGEPIQFRKSIDPKTLNISGQLPPGASETPVSKSISAPAPVPPPHYGILSGGRKMTAQAPGTYEQMISWGWSDAQLIEHGMMTL
jgi:hypothetical protein